MKRLAMLSGLAASAALILAGTASATSFITSTNGATATPSVHLASSGGHVTLQNPIANISCASTAEGVNQSHGSGVTARIALSTLTFTGCTNSWHVTVVAGGSIEVHHTSGHNGLATSSGMKFDATRFGITCVYETNNTSIGPITGGSPAVLKLEASLPLNTAESSALCSTAPGKWEGSYVTTAALFVEA